MQKVSLKFVIFLIDEKLLLSYLTIFERKLIPKSFQKPPRFPNLQIFDHKNINDGNYCIHKYINFIDFLL
jgi:hypothetical protein